MESHSCGHSYGIVVVVVLIWTVTPHGVSASISVGLESGWVGIPFWNRRHETLTIEKRHQTLLVTSKVSHDSLGYLRATRCGLSSQDHKAIDITSPSMHTHRYQIFRCVQDLHQVLLRVHQWCACYHSTSPCSELPHDVRNIGTTTARQTEDP